MGDMVNEAEMNTLREMLQGTEQQEELDKKSEKILSYYTDQLKNDGLFRIKTVVRTGNVHEEILKVAEEEQADMMILGSSGKSALDRLLSGRVTKDLERKASIPVVVAKAGGFSKQKEPAGELQEAYSNAR
jgi:nucleotide-binding universal stress UspA family protein